MSGSQEASGSGDATEEEYQGPLPSFSDDEEPSSSASAVKAPKLLKGLRKKGGVPLHKLKLRPAAASAPSVKAEASSVIGTSSNANPEGRPVKLPVGDEMVRQLMAQLQLQRGPEAAEIGEKDVREILSQLQINRDVAAGKQGLLGRGAKEAGDHKFWASQPVPQQKPDAEAVQEGPLQPNTPHELIPKDPVPLHSDFTFVTMELNNADELKEVYELLTHHYVEDADASFRFDYSADFLRWALLSPGYIKDLHVGIRVAETGKLVAFISGIPVDVRIRAVTKKCSEINFLCVHKKLRSKRMAPLLIKEVTRRSHLQGIFQAVYTAGVVIPTPVTTCQYFHRSLSPKKLVETGFSSVPKGSSVARMALAYKVPTEALLPGLREIEKRDVKAVARLLRAYLGRMDLAPNLSNKEVEHALLGGRGKDVKGEPRSNQVTWTYVVEDPTTHEITDFFSFYSLPSTALKVSPPQSVNAAYLYYYATTACPSCANLGDGSVAVKVQNWQDETAEERGVLKARLLALIGDALILAKRANFDVFNCVTLADNRLFIDDLKFGRGDGLLNYYLYNYSTKPILGGIESEGATGSGTGLVML